MGIYQTRRSSSMETKLKRITRLDPFPTRAEKGLILLRCSKSKLSDELASLVSWLENSEVEYRRHLICKKFGSSRKKLQICNLPLHVYEFIITSNIFILLSTKCREQKLKKQIYLVSLNSICKVV